MCRTQAAEARLDVDDSAVGSMLGGSVWVCMVSVTASTMNVVGMKKLSMGMCVVDMCFRFRCTVSWFSFGLQVFVLNSCITMLKGGDFSCLNGGMVFVSHVWPCLQRNTSTRPTTTLKHFSTKSYERKMSPFYRPKHSNVNLVGWFRGPCTACGCTMQLCCSVFRTDWVSVMVGQYPHTRPRTRGQRAYGKPEW